MIKKEYHEGTLKMLEESRNETKPCFHNILGHDFIVLPGVFSPRYFKDTEFFAGEVPKYVRGKSFLEIGSGTGIISCMVLAGSRIESYKRPISENVVAVDINEKAVKNTFLNSLLILGIEKYNVKTRKDNDDVPWWVNVDLGGCGDNFSGLIKFEGTFGARTGISVRQGDVYSPIPSYEEKFDTIFWNIPFGNYDDGTVSGDVLKQAVFDPEHRNLERYIAGAGEHLTENGSLLIGYSTTLGDYEVLEKLLKEHNMEPAKLLAESGYVREGNPSKPVKFELFESMVKK